MKRFTDVKIFFPLLFSIFISTVSAQTPVADSLLNLLKSAGDTARIRILNELGWEMRGLNPDKSIYYYKESIKLCNTYRDYKRKAKSLNGIGSIYNRQGKFDEAMKYFYESLNIRLSVKDSSGIAMSYSSIANCWGDKGDMQKSKEFMNKAIDISKKTGNQDFIIYCESNLAINYYNEGKYDKALGLYLKSVDYFERIKDNNGLANVLMNIGALYDAMGNKRKSKEFLFRAKPILEKLNDKKLLSACYRNIATIYFNDRKIDSSKIFCQMAVDISNKTDNTYELSDSYNLLAAICRTEKDFKKAMEIDLRNLKVREEIGDKMSIAETYLKLGIDYREMKQFDKSLKSIEKATGLFISENYKYQVIICYNEKAKTFFEMKKFNEAYKFLEKYSALKDSLNSEDMNKKFAEMQTKYETDKKEKENQLLIKNSELKTSELKKQKMWIYFMASGIGLMILLVFFIFRSYHIKKKSNALLKKQNFEIQQKNEEITSQRDEIESQRDEIETQRDLVVIQKNEIELHRDEIAEQKKEILDSIHYANRIQKAILPPEEYVSKNLPEHFILFKPRDIVSGDFYWAKVIHNKLLFCVADCTGHGVPGAFMSMLGIALLNEITNSYISVNCNFKASDILDKLRNNLILSLHQTGKQDEQKDGMDISFCVLNLDNNELQFAGANNPVYIVRKSESINPIAIGLKEENQKLSDFGLSDFRLYELKGDKMPIGIYYGKEKGFTNHCQALDKGDCIYIFSDGYADQFGGSKGKKFKYSQFKELLLGLHDNTIEDQKYILNYAFEQWKDNYPQIDDVCIIGLKV